MVDREDQQETGVSSDAPSTRTRSLTVLAQDPAVRDPAAPARKQILRAQPAIPAETLQPGPEGYRLQVVDYDVSQDTFYKPFKPDPEEDLFAGKTDRQLLGDPHFHCQNVYALVMRTLARFEFALGRRVRWSFGGHQLTIVPHAFAEANAFYSPNDRALLFGYFPSRHSGDMIFTCLSHDVVVHEATHALLDGLRERYTDPSSADQAAFHEGFADVVALLSVFSLPDVAGRIIDLGFPPEGTDPDKDRELIARAAVSMSRLRKSGLLGLADEMGSELSVVRGNALRRSADELYPPDDRYYLKDPDFRESHRRGEILVAAVMNAFLETWVDRMKGLGDLKRGYLSRDRVVEEGAEIAETLLNLVIRALDYTPPVHVEFGDFLSAALTSDTGVRPDDGKYQLRRRLRESFAAYGIEPASGATGGLWEPAPEVDHTCTHFEPMRSEPDEVFRFIWENRGADRLEISEEAYSRIISVRPSVRVGPDGFVLREVVAEHVQTLNVEAGELWRSYRIKKPAGMPGDTPVRLHGGGTLIFDEYGRLQYHIYNKLLHRDRQMKRLQYLWDHGHYRKDAASRRHFSNIHRQRAVGREGSMAREEW